MKVLSSQMLVATQRDGHARALIVGPVSSGSRPTERISSCNSPARLSRVHVERNTRRRAAQRVVLPVLSIC